MQHHLTSTWPISAKKSSMVFIIINNRYSAIQWCFTNFREKIYSSVVKVEPIISLTELNIQQISTVMVIFIGQRGRWTEGIDSMWLCSLSIQLMSKIQKTGKKCKSYLIKRSSILFLYLSANTLCVLVEF